MTSSLRRVQSLIKGTRTSDGGGVELTRVIGGSRLNHLDPFLLLDNFHNDNPDSYIAGFPSHPHRGFETVTYMLAGAVEHRDSVGNVGRLGPGWIQWMTAGRGIIHSEMPQEINGLMSGFQIWVNLPAKQKMCAPRYQDIPPEKVPIVDLEEGKVRVLAGRFNDVEGPVEDIVTRPLLLDVEFTKKGETTVEIPEGHNAFVYCFEGEINVEGGEEKATSLGFQEGGVLSDGEKVVLSGTKGRVLVMAGQPLNEPIARSGPFVMNTQDEIRQAMADYHSGNFAK